MDERREGTRGGEVVVTGVGMVTPLGTTAAETVGAWREGRCAVRRTVPELAGTPLEEATVAALPSLDAARRLGGRRHVKYMSEAAVLGCVAAREAATAARLGDRFAPERIGLYTGTGLAAARMRDVEPMIEASIGSDGAFSCRRFGREGLARTNPILSFKILANMPSCLVSILEGIRGPNLLFSPWEGQTAAALMEAWRAVASGVVDSALAGAADDATQAITVVLLTRSRYLGESDYAGAGAAYLVLERRETAERDGVAIHAACKGMDLRPAGETPRDPLRERCGRTFAAAPAILMGLACCHAVERVSITGVDRQQFEAELLSASWNE